MHIVTLLFLICLTGQANADCVLVPIIGDGSDNNPYRPAIPPVLGAKIPWSAHIPSQSNGAPMFSDAYVCFPDWLVIPAQIRLSKADVDKAILSRDPKADVSKVKTSNKKTSSLDHPIYHFLKKYFSIAVAWAAVATDNFNRTSSTDLGANWDGGYTSTDSCQIDGNIAVSGITEGGRCIETYNAFIPGNNQYVQIQSTGISLTGTPNYEIGAVVRASAPPTFTLYVCRVGQVGADTSIIQKRIAGLATLLANSATETWVTGDVVRLEAVGTGLSCQRNGGEILSATDSAIAGGRGGIWITDGASSSELTLDNFEVGDVAAGTITRHRTIVIQ